MVPTRVEHGTPSMAGGSQGIAKSDRPCASSAALSLPLSHRFASARTSANRRGADRLGSTMRLEAARSVARATARIGTRGRALVRGSAAARFDARIETAGDTRSRRPRTSGAARSTGATTSPRREVLAPPFGCASPRLSNFGPSHAIESSISGCAYRTGYVSSTLCWVARNHHSSPRRALSTPRFPSYTHWRRMRSSCFAVSR